MPAKSLFENFEWCCFRGKGRMARRDEGEYPWWIFDLGATKPAGLFRENPPGGGSFVRGLRWLGRYSPLRGCSGLAALATVKIPRRSAPRSFQTGSNVSCGWLTWGIALLAFHITSEKVGGQMQRG